MFIILYATRPAIKTYVCSKHMFYHVNHSTNSSASPTNKQCVNHSFQTPLDGVHGEGHSHAHSHGPGHSHTHSHDHGPGGVHGHGSDHGHSHNLGQGKSLGYVQYYGRGYHHSHAPGQSHSHNHQHGPGQRHGSFRENAADSFYDFQVPKPYRLRTFSGWKPNRSAARHRNKRSLGPWRSGVYFHHRPAAVDSGHVRWGHNRVWPEGPKNHGTVQQVEYMNPYPDTTP